MTISRETGFSAALETACFSNNTNALPFVIGAAIAPLVAPSRFVGVWIQAGLLYLFVLSLLVYLVRIRRLKPATALAGCFAFLATKCLYFSNGGLSDFRMDLSLYLGFAMTCVWYLTCMARPTVAHFLLFGVAASITCLFRATAPIYLLFSLAPLCLIELIVKDKRRQKLTGIAVATLVVTALAGWFYVLNFEFLKYYYFEWNTDANAKIPLSDALRHWNLAQRSVGEAATLLMVSWIIGVMVVTRRRESITSWVSRAWRFRELDWRIGWLAMSPIVLLVARRAGLNPFVCMPAVFGLMLFFALPCMHQMDWLANRKLSRFCQTMLIVCLMIALARGWKRHTVSEFNTMAAHRQLVDNMLQDARLRHAVQLNFGVMHLTDLNANSLYSMLLFDRRDAIPGLDGVTIGGVKIRRVATFMRPAAADWRGLEGETDDQKLTVLLEEAKARMDYLILPDEKTAAELETTAAHNYINRYLVPLRNRVITDPTWVQVGEPVPTDDKEVVEIYRHNR